MFSNNPNIFAYTRPECKIVELKSQSVLCQSGVDFGSLGAAGLDVEIEGIDDLIIL